MSCGLNICGLSAQHLFRWRRLTYWRRRWRAKRGRTSMDRVVEAVRRNPFSMIVLEDVDQADGLVRGRIKRAMEQGRLVDSYSREVSLGSVIFILTSSWVPKELKRTHDSLIQCEEKILQSVGHGWRLQLSAQRTPGTRCFD